MQRRFQTIQHVGQEFLDQPVFQVTRPRLDPGRVADAVSRACGRHIPPIPEERVQVGWERTHLRWMRPGPDGKLVPR